MSDEVTEYKFAIQPDQLMIMIPTMFSGVFQGAGGAPIRIVTIIGPEMSDHAEEI